IAMLHSKRIYFIALKTLPVFLPFCIRAQAFRLEPGVQLVARGTPQLVLNNISMIINGAFAADSSTVLFTGGLYSSALIDGDHPLSFYNLNIGMSSGDVKLNNNIAVAGHITMTSGSLQLNRYNLDLGRTGSIIGERASSCITGADGGTITVTASLIAPQAVNPGNIGVEFTSFESLGSTVITRGHESQASAGGATSI